jgi:hypothetical protein
VQIDKINPSISNEEKLLLQKKNEKIINLIPKQDKNIEINNSRKVRRLQARKTY